jgi:hypothetical protein
MQGAREEIDIRLGSRVFCIQRVADGDATCSACHVDDCTLLGLQHARKNDLCHFGDGNNVQIDHLANQARCIVLQLIKIQSTWVRDTNVVDEDANLVFFERSLQGCVRWAISIRAEVKYDGLNLYDRRWLPCNKFYTRICQRKNSETSPCVPIFLQFQTRPQQAFLGYERSIQRSALAWLALMRTLFRFPATGILTRVHTCISGLLWSPLDSLTSVPPVTTAHSP